MLEGIENSIIIKKDGKVGLVNDNGSIIVEPQYKEIKNLGNTYKEGYITINEQGKYGVTSATKKQTLENIYEKIEQTYLEDYFVVTAMGKQKLINSKGNILIEYCFDEIKSVTSKGLIFVKNNLYGEISPSGEITIEAKFQDLKEAKEGTYIAKQNEKTESFSI